MVTKADHLWRGPVESGSVEEVDVIQSFVSIPSTEYKQVVSIHSRGVIRPLWKVSQKTHSGQIPHTPNGGSPVVWTLCQSYVSTQRLCKSLR